MISITAFGALFIPLLLVALMRRTWMPAAIVVSAVLQAPAPLVVTLGESRLGITSFNLAVVAASIALVIELWRDRGAAVRRALDRFTVPWAVYLAYAALAALVLPFLFADAPVHPLLAVGDVRPETVPNTFSIAHVAQAINHAGLLVLFAYLAVRADRSQTLRMLTIGFGVALAVSLAAAAYQRAVFLGWYAADFAFWASNPSYNQFFHAPDYGPAFGRVGLPFTEPSYASVWFASVLGGALLVWLYECRGAPGWALALAGAVLAGIGLLNTVGTSGLVAIAAFVPVVLVRHVLVRGTRSPRGDRKVAALAIAVAAGAGLVALDLFVLRTEAGAPVRAAIEFIQHKLTTRLEHLPRYFTTFHALQLFVDSYGIGIGPGSTRTSGFAVSALAHLGVPGIALLGWAAYRTLRTLESAPGRPASRFAAGLLYAGGIGVAVGIADLAWPVAWTWVLFAVAAARAVAADDGPGGRAEALAQHSA